MPIPDSGFRCKYCRNLYHSEEKAAECEKHHVQAGELYREALRYCVERDLPYGTVITITVFPADNGIRVVTPDSKHRNGRMNYNIYPAELPYTKPTEGDLSE